jgi:VCBS repeat-containing protein
VAKPIKPPKTGNSAVGDSFVDTENVTALFDVLLNDKGNNNTLYSLNQVDPLGVSQATALSALGATITISNGKISYNPNGVAAIEALAQGQTTTDSFTYTIDEGSGKLSSATVTVTLTGVNDAPVVTGAVFGSASEDGVISTLDALANASDVDNGTTLSVVNLPASLPAGVSYNAATHFFSLNAGDAAYQHLAAGVTTTVTVSYGVSDGIATTPASVSWTVTGTNDAPVVTGAVTGSAAEDGASSTLDALGNASDVDDGATLSVVGLPATLPAGVSHDAASHSFSLNSAHAAYQNLAVGETTTVTVNYGVSDGLTTTPASVSWTVSGTNDAPTVSAEVSGGGAEGSGLASVNLLDFASDVDNGAVLHVANLSWDEGSGLPAGFSQVGNSITVDTDALAYNGLAAGETFTTHFSYDVVDEHGAAVAQHATVTITGTNDGAIIGGSATGTVQEDVGAVSGELSTSGDLTVADVDNGEAVFQAQTATAGSNGYGTFTLEADGHWTYAADNSQAAIQGLAIDESLTDSFTAVSADGTASQTVTVTINGSNDVIYTADGTVDASATKAPIKPNELIVGSGIPANHFGLAEQTDVGVELGLQVIYRQGPAVTTADTYADGELHFTVNDGPQSTANGSSSSRTDRAAWSFDYSIATGLNGEPTDLDDFTFNLLYDVDPTAGTLYRTLTLEAGGTGSSGHQWRDQGTGLVFIADDAGNADVTQNSENYAFTFVQSFLTSPYGVSNNFDGPAEFDIVLEAHRGGQLLASNHIVVDVVESNHAPVANPDSNGADAVREAGVNPGNTPFAGDLSALGNVLANDTDVDFGDVKTVSAVNGSAANVGVALTGTYGSLTLNANGSWTYTLNNADPDTNALAHNQAASDVFTYTMRDLDGATSSSTLTINITGTNDAPVVTGDTSAALTEDQFPLLQRGELTASDPDIGATQTWSIVGGPGTTTTALQDFTFAMDEFRIVRNNQLFFDDNFSNNAAPPSAPNIVGGNPTSYSAGGTFFETVDRLLLVGTNSTLSAVNINGLPSAGISATLNTNTNPSDPIAGLKSNMSFTVEGRFDLVMPIDVRDQYGIRLTDSTSPTTGDDVVGLAVRRDADGLFVNFSDLNFLTATGTPIQRIALNPLAGDDQIVLKLSHDQMNPGVITATFDLLDNGTVTWTQTFTSAGQIFSNENWTRAQIIANGAPETISVRQGTYSTLSVDQDGDWVARVRNGQPAVQALAEGETVTETFQVQVTDQHGASDIENITVTVTGENDAPVITSVGNGQLVLLSGQYDVSHFYDDMANSDPTADFANANPTHFRSIGPVTFDFYGQGLQYALGQNGHDFDVTAGTITEIDWSGPGFSAKLTGLNIDAAQASVAIHAFADGANDRSGLDTIFSSLLSMISENSAGQVSGTATATDIDHNAALTWSVVGENGPHIPDYHFQIDNLKVIKNGGAIFEDTFGDGNPPPSAPNFLPPNNSPGSYSTGNVFTEAGGRVIMDGAVGATPLAIGEGVGHFATLNTNTDPANLVNGLKSSHDFTVEGRFDLILPDIGERYGIRLTDANGPGHPGDDCMSLAVSRETDGQLRVVLTELDFVASTRTPISSVLLNPAAGDDQIVLRLTHDHVNNPGKIFASFDLMDGGVVTSASNMLPGFGQVFGSETPGNPEDDENYVRAEFTSSDNIGTTHYGTLTINQGGTWSYDLANESALVQALAEGESVIDSFTVQVTDEHGAADTETINITVTGENDAPVITGGVTTGSVQEDGPQMSAGGTLTAVDVDHGATRVWSIVGGSMPNAVDYHFEIDNFQVVRNGTLWYDDAFDDGNPPPVGGSFLPNTADAIAGSYQTPQGFVTETGGRAILDGADSAGSFVFGGGLGHFIALNSDTSDDLTRGLKIDDDFTVEGRFDLAFPDFNQNYGIRVTDANGTAHPGDDVIQLTVQSGPGGLFLNMVRITFVTNTPAVPIAFLPINPQPGDDQIVLRLHHDHLNPGVITASYELLDGGIPTGGGTLVGSTQIFGLSTPGNPADNELYTRAQFVAGESLVPSMLNGDYGTLSVNQNGTWTYVLANGQQNVQALAAGQTVYDTFQIQVTDEHGASDSQTVTIAVHGQNDGPVAADDFASGNEDTPIATGNVLANDSDVDGALTPASITGYSQGANGVVVSNGDGTFTYTPDLNFNGSDSFTYAISDGALSSTATVNVTVNAVNDPAVITGDNSGSVTEDGASVAAGDLNSTDVDNPNDAWQAILAPATSTGGYGTYTVGPNGVWNYTLNNSHPALQTLNSGQTLSDSFTVYTADGTAQMVSITINGADEVAANQAPVVHVTGATGFTSIDVPGSTYTMANGINDAGEIVGQAGFSSGPYRAFDYNAGVFTTYNVAGNTNAGAINNAGVVTGYYEPFSSTPRYGFTENNGVITNPISLSPNISTTIDGINDAGVMVGASYSNGGDVFRGFIQNGMAVTLLDAPGANYTVANEINNFGQVVGTTTPSYGSNWQGFLYQGGVFTTFVDPLGVNGTFAQGLNDAGQIVGFYNVGPTSHGFLYQGGVFTTIDNPLGVNGTVIQDINDSGQIVGYYLDGSNVSHGFAASLAGTTNEDMPLAINGISVSDSDAGSDPISFSLAVTHGALALASTAGLAGDIDGSNGTLSFTGSQADINAALASGLTYTPDVNYFGSDTLNISVNDIGHNGSGGALSDNEMVAITVNAVNDAPTINVAGPTPPVTQQQVTGQSYLNTFENGASDTSAPQILNLNQAYIVDDAGHGDHDLVIEGSLFHSIEGMAADLGANASEFYDITGASLSGGHVMTSVTAAAGATLSFDWFFNGGGNPYDYSFFAVDGEVYFLADTVGVGGYSVGSPWVTQSFTFAQGGTHTIGFGAIHTGPSASLPNLRLDNVTVSGPETVSSTTITGLSVADVDAGNDALEVSLAAAQGSLELLNTGGLSFSDGDGSDGTLTFQGSQSAINAALASGLVYTADAGATEDDTLAISLSDLGHNGTGGALSDSESIAIPIPDPVQPNEPPVAMANSYSVAEASNLVQTVLAVDAAHGVLSDDFDADDGPNALTAVLVSGPAHAQSFQLNANGSFSYAPQAYYSSYAPHDTAPGTFSFLYDFVGNDTFTYQAFDGSSYSAEITVQITVAPPAHLHVNPYGYDMQGSYDAASEPMGKFYDDLALGTLTFSQIPGATPQTPIPLSNGFRVSTGTVTYDVQGTGLTYDAGIPSGGLINGSLRILNPAYDPVAAQSPGYSVPPVLFDLMPANFGPEAAWEVEAADFVQALQSYASTHDRSGLDAIFQSVRYDFVGAGPAGHENDVMTGAPFDDYFAGAAGNDTVYGGPGNELIIPGAGAGPEYLTSGPGADQLQFGSGDGLNYITDFSGIIGGQHDLIDLRALLSGGASFAEVLSHTSDDGLGNTVIDFGSLTLVLQNHSSADLREGDFLYGFGAPPPPPSPPPTAMSVSNFTSLNYPGTTNNHSYAAGINNAGVIAGFSQTYDAGSIQGYDGWLYENGIFTTIHIGNQNGASDINSFGVVGGSYSPGNSTPRYGFIENGATVTTVNLPPNVSTTVDGINDAGNFVGSSYLHAGTTYSAFASIGGVVTYLNPFGSSDAHANGINNANDIVGTYGSHAYLRHNGLDTTVDAPLGVNGTVAGDINNAGQIVGWYVDAGNQTHGFINTGGVFTAVDHPFATGGTVVRGISDAGQIVGAYYIGGTPHAFTATINNPVGQSTNDVLVASPQGSTLNGGAGSDTFVFNFAPQAQSTIADFTPGQDVLQVSAAGFGHGLTSGAAPAFIDNATPAAAFHAGSDGYFFFSGPAANTLYWDSTGGSGLDAVAVAQLQNVNSLSVLDFHIV